MIDYDPAKYWEVTWRLKGTVFHRVWSRVLILVLFSILVVQLESFHLFDVPNLPAQGHIFIGVALGLLIVFRNNTSFGRFWEGRRLWDQILNSSRNLVRQAVAYSNQPAELQRLLAAFALSVKVQLRGSGDFSALSAFLSVDDLKEATATDKPSLWIAGRMTAWVRQQVDRHGMQMSLAIAMENRINHLIECQGHCEGIATTPMPLLLSAHCKQILFVYLIALPFVLLRDMTWGTPIAVGLLAFALLGIDEAAAEIENPFGTDTNDLPLDEVCAIIVAETAPPPAPVGEPAVPPSPLPTVIPIGKKRSKRSRVR